MEERKKMTFKEQLLFILGVCGWICLIFVGIPHFLYEIFIYLYKIMGNSLYYILGGIGLLVLIFSMVKVFSLAMKKDWTNFDYFPFHKSSGYSKLPHIYFDDVSMRESNGYQEPPKPIYTKSDSFDGYESCLDRPSTPCPSFVSSSMPNNKKN